MLQASRAISRFGGVGILGLGIGLVCHDEIDNHVARFKILHGFADDQYVIQHWDQSKSLPLHPSLLTDRLIREKGCTFGSEVLEQLTDEQIQRHLTILNINQLLTSRSVSDQVLDEIVTTNGVDALHGYSYRLSSEFVSAHVKEFADAGKYYVLNGASEEALETLTDEQLTTYLTRFFAGRMFSLEFLDRHWDKIKNFRLRVYYHNDHLGDPSQVFTVPEYVSSQYVLTEAFMNKHKDDLNWHLLTRYQDMTWNFRKRFKDRVDWRILMNPVRYSGGVEWFLKAYPEMRKNKPVKMEDMNGQLQRLLELCPNRIDFSGSWFEELKELDECVISQYKDRLPINDLAKHRKFSKEFVQEHLGDKLNPLMASRYQWQSLTMDQVKQHGYRMDWYVLLEKMDVQEHVIDRFMHIIDLNVLVRNKHLSEGFIEKHIDRLDMSYLSRYRRFSSNFREKYDQYIDYDDNWLYMEPDEISRRMARLSDAEKEEVQKILNGHMMTLDEIKVAIEQVPSKVARYDKYDGKIRIWVLEDAIKSVCHLGQMKRGTLTVHEPFIPQALGEGGKCVYVEYVDIVRIDVKTGQIVCRKMTV